MGGARHVSRFVGYVLIRVLRGVSDCGRLLSFTPLLTAQKGAINSLPRGVMRKGRIPRTSQVKSYSPGDHEGSAQRKPQGPARWGRVVGMHAAAPAALWAASPAPPGSSRRRPCALNRARTRRIPDGTEASAAG
jgi:hypothetical protein